MPKLAATIIIKYTTTDEHYPIGFTDKEKRELEKEHLKRLKTPSGMSSYLSWLKNASVEHSIEVNVE